jgi:hypothetical protein
MQAPSAIMGFLNALFSRLDELLEEKYNDSLWKVETIGDASHASLLPGSQTWCGRHMA